MVTLLWYSILWWRKDKCGRFELEDDGNFFLGNQELSSHSIRLDSFLPVGTPHHGPRAALRVS